MSEEVKFNIRVGNSVSTGVGEVKTLYIKRDNGLETRIDTIAGPTHNCQLSIIGAFINLLGYSDEELKTLVKRIAKENQLRNIIQIDIQRYKVQKIESAFKGCIINKMDYTSTNGNQMTIILLRTASL